MNDAALLTKRCTKCGAEKPLAEFSKNRKGRDGLQTRCKACVKAQRPFDGTVLKKRREEDAAATGKVCKDCGNFKPLADFHISKRSRCGHKERCKKCVARQRGAADRRLWLLKAKYGLSPADYERLFVQQGGRCAICGSADPRGKSRYFVVDHDHETGEVRALLCNKCNPAIGLMDDDPGRLEAAARYLRAFKRG